MDHDKDALENIHITVIYALDLAKGMTWKDFVADIGKQAAIQHKLMVIGESANRLSHSFKESHPDIPWSKIIGMRNKLAHNFDNVDLTIVWDTLTIELPVLCKKMELIEKTNRK